MEKVFVKVNCTHMEDGTVMPNQIFWEDGRNWNIGQVVHYCQSSDIKHEGIRYTVIIGSAEKYIYLLGSRWYVETG